MTAEAIEHYMSQQKNTLTSAIAQKNMNEDWKSVKDRKYQSAKKEMKKNILEELGKSKKSS